jgi:hypothetical protein
MSVSCTYKALYPGIVLAIALLVSPAKSAEFTWGGGATSDTWMNPTNWSGDAAPASLFFPQFDVGYSTFIPFPLVRMSHRRPFSAETK